MVISFSIESLEEAVMPSIVLGRTWWRSNTDTTTDTLYALAEFLIFVWVETLFGGAMPVCLPNGMLDPTFGSTENSRSSQSILSGVYGSLLNLL